ncbi:MAG: HPr family phosphocarrier protein [Maricaulaceae bacterium]
MNAPAASARVEIRNRRGLHARASAKFVRLASVFQAEIAVTRGESEVDARSIMGLLMLAAGPGSEIEIRADGADADAAVKALTALVAEGFGETD